MSNSCFVETNGIKLHYLDHAGDGPTMIFMHGLTANAHSFDGLIKAGLSPQLHVLALDLRGRGLSDKPDNGYSMADHAADVIGLLDHLGIQQAILGGHSFGGLLTYYLASHFPDRVQKCVVLDAPAHVHLGILDQIKPSLDRLGITYPSWEDYIGRIKAAPFFPNGWWNSEVEAYYRADVQVNEDGTVQARSNSDHIMEAAQGTLDEDWAAHLAKINQPLLFLRAPDPFGADGFPPLVPEDKAVETVGMLVNARRVDIPGNHITFVFGNSADLMVKEIVAFVLAN